jgi:hypothetical protein
MPSWRDDITMERHLFYLYGAGRDSNTLSTIYTFNYETTNSEITQYSHTHKLPPYAQGDQQLLPCFISFHTVNIFISLSVTCVIRNWNNKFCKHEVFSFESNCNKTHKIR